MNTRYHLHAVGLASSMVLAGCALTPSKYENGQYVPPPSDNPLKIIIQANICGSKENNLPIGEGFPGVLVPTLANVTHDRFINWLDVKQANLSASSSGVTTSSFFVKLNTPSGCLKIERADSLVAEFSIVPIEGSAYWHMVPYSLNFKQSEAKEVPDGVKSIVAEITFASPDARGSLVTFFQGTFDLGKHKSGVSLKVANGSTPFVGQDSGPIAYPKGGKLDQLVTMKVSAFVTEHGEGRDWIRGVTNAQREEENRGRILQPLIDAITNVW